MASSPETSQAAETTPVSHGIAPRWQAVIGILALGILNAILPSNLTFGPGWLPLVIEVILSSPFIIEGLTDLTLPYRVKRTLAFILLAVVTGALISSVIFLIFTLTSSTSNQAITLLRSAMVLWISNILVFALWYWEVDGGGPIKRHQNNHQLADFMFPQQVSGNTTAWSPHFLDYVFLAFTGATALSPADTYPMTRVAKMLMMIEALISLVIVVLLAARAVNIL